ncbi:MAG: efflux RND transporter periplasmic adaptor subunit [Dokdonella sp.]|nr:efflux RND transporter periplasmic adaptor subunit [Dokdonella sp.]
MKKSRLILLALIAVSLALVAGYLLGKRGHTAASTDQAAASEIATPERKALYWKAPMDPNFRSDKPGKSPMGMDLVPVYADGSGSSESSDVRIDPAVVNNLGVRTAEVMRGSLANRIEAVGYVGYDEDTLTSINTRAEGWVEKLAVKSVGDPVRKGQLLYALFSPKLATAEREYLTALASGSQSLIATSRERMRSFGFSNAQIEQLSRTRKVGNRVARYAASTGVVMKLGVSEGAWVMPATQVMQLANLDTVWVLVEVDPANTALLHKGQVADVTFDAFAGESWQGTVDYIYPDVSAMTRTVKVRVRLPNPDRRLQPNMYAHVGLQTAAQNDTVYIPALALIETGQSKRVVVAQGDGRFDVCPVQTGATSGDQVEIRKGLRAGQRVVTSAQFMIDSEANIDAATLRLSAGKSACDETSGPVAEPDDSSDMSGMDMSGPHAATHTADDTRKDESEAASPHSAHDMGMDMTEPDATMHTEDDSETVNDHSAHEMQP